LARVALGVLVGQLRALRRHHGRRGVVFRRDQLDVIFLTLVLGLDGRPQFGVNVGQLVLGAVKHDVAVLFKVMKTPSKALEALQEGCPGERRSRPPGLMPDAGRAPWWFTTSGPVPASPQ